VETVVRRIADWVVGLRFDDLPPEVVERAKLCILDQLGVQLRGATLPWVRPALELARSLGARPESTIVLHGERTAAPYAALANATFGHSCEYDDSHFHTGHPGVCTIPVALALGERGRASGADVIAAVVAGYQAMVLACGPVHHRTLELGWHGTKVGGVFGAAAVAARLLGLDAAQTAEALAVAASEASGTMEYDRSGGEVKRVHAGLAARSGMEAALPG
jgi:2-methylcitrate dehydratase PrpD